MQPEAIVLREKDLPEEEYVALAKEVMTICARHNTPCILHSYVSVAKRLGLTKIHLPLPLLRSLSSEDKSYFDTIGASCHSLEDAKEAERLGATYVTAGHIFNTDCKKGLPGRGIDFLKEICRGISIPVYAIGGITKENYPTVIAAGATGACIMSGFMRA